MGSKLLNVWIGVETTDCRQSDSPHSLAPKEWKNLGGGDNRRLHSHRESIAPKERHTKIWGENALRVYGLQAHRIGPHTGVHHSLNKKIDQAASGSFFDSSAVFNVWRGTTGTNELDFNVVGPHRIAVRPRIL
jgi:hypothetical protein